MLIISVALCLYLVFGLVLNTLSLAEFNFANGRVRFCYFFCQTQQDREPQCTNMHGFQRRI